MRWLLPARVVDRRDGETRNDWRSIIFHPQQPIEPSNPGPIAHIKRGRTNADLKGIKGKRLRFLFQKRSLQPIHRNLPKIMESTEQNAVYQDIQSHPQNTIEINTMLNDARGGEPAEIHEPSSEGCGLPGVIDLTAEPVS